jgi:hypothetical protein
VLRRPEKTEALAAALIRRPPAAVSREVTRSGPCTGTFKTFVASRTAQKKFLSSLWLLPEVLSEIPGRISWLSSDANARPATNALGVANILPEL